MTDEISQLKQRLAAVEAERNRLAATPAIDAALASVGVRPQFRKAVRALFLSRGELELSGGDVFIDDVPVKSVIRAWASTAEGQAHLGKEAPTARRRSEMSLVEKAAYCRQHGVAAFEKLPR